jgi:carboxypeptidase Taq
VTALAKLKHRFERIAIINEASSMLGWDSSVMMPLGGAAARSDQLAVLAGLSHQLLTDPATEEWLAAASTPAQEPADEWEAANLRLGRGDELTI